MTINTYGSSCSLWVNKISVDHLKAFFQIYKYTTAKFSIINRLSTISQTFVPENQAELELFLISLDNYYRR